MKQNIISELLTIILLVSFFSCVQKQKVPDTLEGNSLSEIQKVYEWRGENRSGIYNEKRLLKVWPEEGPEIVWEYEGIGNGYGSPIFTSDNMYILGEIDTVAYLFAFDLNGKLLWKKDFGNEWAGSYRGSRSSPTVVDGLVYVTSGFGNLFCFDRRSGEKKWSINMIHDLHGILPIFGYSESVVIDGEKVFCTPGGKDDNVVALNRFTGEGACEVREQVSVTHIIHLKLSGFMIETYWLILRPTNLWDTIPKPVNCFGFIIKTNRLNELKEMTKPIAIRYAMRMDIFIIQPQGREMVV